MTNTKEIKDLEEKIGTHIGVKSTELIFNYSDENKGTKLDLVTVNPIHNQSFLFHSVTASSSVDSLHKMLEYIKNYKEKESSFTLQWSLKGSSELNTSYFRASNLKSAVEKFYFARDINSTIVFSVVLNPIS